MKLEKFVLFNSILMATYFRADASLPPSTSTEPTRSLEDKLLDHIVYFMEDNNKKLGEGVFVEWQCLKRILVRRDIVKEKTSVKIAFYVDDKMRTGRAFQVGKLEDIVAMRFVQDEEDYSRDQIQCAKVYNTMLQEGEWLAPCNSVMAFTQKGTTFRPIRLTEDVKVLATMASTTKKARLVIGDFLFFEDQILAVLVRNTPDVYTYNTISWLLETIDLGQMEE